MHAAARISRPLCSLTALVALVLGVPVLLARAVGWPLPSSWPVWDDVRSALDGASVSDAVLLKGLACAGWIAWALLCACTIAEGAAYIRGRTATRVPFAGILQPLARELVVGVTLVAGSLRAGAPMAMPPAVAAVATHEAVSPVAVQLPVNDPADSISREAVEAHALPQYVVQPRDSLWKIAERHLGDGLRWREIWELNRDETQVNGARFCDPNLIHPGWILAMPVDATAVETAPSAPVNPPPDHGSTTAVEDTAPTPAPSPVTTTETTVSQQNAHLDDDRDGTTPDDPDDPDYRAIPLLAGAALVAAGVIKTVERLRRRQMRHLEAGQSIRLPDEPARRAEVHLRHAADVAGYDRIDLALRNLAATLMDRDGGELPAIEAVTLGPQAVEILLSGPVIAPPGPFDVAAEWQAWTLPASVPEDELRQVAEKVTGPAPALVTVGTVDERSVLIDLEAAPRTLVGGDPDDASALFWTMVLDLATSNRADDLEVVVVGKAPGGLPSLDRIRVVAEVEDLLDELELHHAATASGLRAGGYNSTLEARSTPAGDPWTPVVVLVDHSPGGSGVDRLLELAEPGSGIAVVVVGDVDGELDRELCVEDDTLLLKPLGLRLRPSALPSHIVEQSGEIVAAALDVRGVAERHHAATDVSSNGHRRRPTLESIEFDDEGKPVLPEGHVLVRTTGPVEIVGGLRPIDRRRSIEFVVYLALHPEGADESRIMAALWPESRPTRSAFNETTSRARRCLGMDPHGKPHVRHAERGVYRLGPFVHLDRDLIASGVPGAERLPRGEPLQSPAGYEWAHEEGVLYDLRSPAR